MIIEAIHNHIVFEFLDKVTNAGMFEPQKTEGGIELLKSADDSAGQPRWARIISLGPECSEELRNPNCEILIENLKWTAGVKFGSTNVWRTDESHVVAYRILDGSNTISFEE